MIFVTIETASATVSYQDWCPRIYISDTHDGVCNIKSLYSDLVNQYNESYVKENILNETSPKVWLLKGYIKDDTNECFWINSSDVEELRLVNDLNKYNLEGYFEINDTRISTWDINTNDYCELDNSRPIKTFCNITNSQFNSISKVQIGSEDDSNPIEGLNFKNVTINNCKYGVTIQNANYITVENVTVKNGDKLFGSGFRSCTMDNSTLSNIQIINVSNYMTACSGSYGFQVIGNNNLIHDIYIDGCAWSGTNIQGMNTTAYNITVLHAGHNGIEFQSSESYLKNVTARYICNHSFFVASTTKNVHNSTYEDIYLADTLFDSSNLKIAEQAYNIVIKNVTSVGQGVLISESDNITLINCTQNDSFVGFATTLIGDKPCNKDHKLIDSSFLGNSYKDICFVRGENMQVLNTAYDSLKVDKYYVGNWSNAYYLDMFVTDSDNKPISGSKITLRNDVNALFPSINGYCINKTEYLTCLDGHTSSPIKNRSNSPSVIEFYNKYGLPNQYCTYTAEISTLRNKTISLSKITPDSSWYREDPNIPTYTITAIIPDNSTGPHITGFAPSEENPFTPGEKKIFRIWTDEPLTTMEWYIDSGVEPVYAGDMNYTWTAEKGGHTISFIGSNANGTVNESWEIMGGYGALPAPIIEFFPTDTVLTRKTGESDTFSVNSDQPLTTNWSVNGKLIQNDTTSITQSWNTSGTYEVTVNGFSGEEEILNTWMVNVTDSVKSQDTSNVTVTPEYQIVIPNQSFAIDVEIDPSTTINGAQFDLLFDSSMVRVDSVAEGNLFKQEGAITHFINGIINNTTGTVTYVYGSVLESNVSSPGVFATVTLTAGSNTGITELNLSNVIVSDSNSKAAPTTINDATILIDTAPVLNSIGSKSVSETNSMSFMVGASDADGDSLIYSATDLPEGARFDPESGMFSWTPSRGQAGVYTATFEVSDGYLNDSENVSITVNPANNIPVIDSFRPEDGAIYNEKDKINILVNASDLDGQFLYYVIKINGITYSTEPSYIWKTNYSSSGEHTVEVTVSDGTDQVTEQHTLYIKDYHPSWDVNEDDVVNILDISNVSQKYGMTTTEPYPRWDVNQDGVVNIQDLSIVGYYFGEEMK